MTTSHLKSLISALRAETQQDSISPESLALSAYIERKTLVVIITGTDGYTQTIVILLELQNIMFSSGTYTIIRGYIHSLVALRIISQDSTSFLVIFPHAVGAFSPFFMSCSLAFQSVGISRIRSISVVWLSNSLLLVRAGTVTRPYVVARGVG